MFLSRLHTVDGPPGYWYLEQPLIWDDGEHRIEVPVGFLTDLASIPAPMRGVLNTNGRSRKPAVVHDYLYQSGKLDRKAADDLFLEMLIAEGVICIGRGLYFAGV